MGKFVIKKTATGFNFSLFANNNEKIAVSSEVYTTKNACMNGIMSVGKNSVKCIQEGRIEDQTLKNPEKKTCPRFEIYNDKAGLFRYRLIATNGENILICEEGYKTKLGCKIGMKSVSKNSPVADIVDETLEQAK
jgi:uncharacterized protein YegP (UPF0339 family)